MKLTRYGRREWLSSLLLVFCVVFIAFLLEFFLGCSSWRAFTVFSAVLFLCWCLFAAFFRDPERDIASDASAILSPCDGVVQDIELIKPESAGSDQFQNLSDDRDMLRIGIQLSPWCVRLFRTPVPMKFLFREFNSGFFANTSCDGSSQKKESVILGAEARYLDTVYPLMIRAIVSGRTRSAVCPEVPEEELPAGREFGMLISGSRTELYLPAGVGIEVSVKVGESVLAGVSPLAHIYPAAGAKIRKTNFSDKTNRTIYQK